MITFLIVGYMVLFMGWSISDTVLKVWFLVMLTELALSIGGKIMEASKEEQWLI